MNIEKLKSPEYTVLQQVYFFCAEGLKTGYIKDILAKYEKDDTGEWIVYHYTLLNKNVTLKETSLFPSKEAAIEYVTNQKI